MVNFKELRVLSMRGSEKVLVGAVRCPLDATFGVVRKEIEMDELVSYPFDFVILDSVLRGKQEARWQVHENEVHIKQRYDIQPVSKRQCLEGAHKDGVLDMEHSPETGLGEVADCESNNEKRLEACKKEHACLTENQLKSKLVPSDILLRWECEAERVRARLTSRGREDKFDIYTRDEGGEVIIKVWCLECGRTYGSGKDPVTSAYRTLSNFQQSHIRSATHRDNYAANHGVDPDALPRAEKTHKEEIEAAMLEVSNFNSSHPGASFEIVQLTLGNFSNKHHVFMRCTLDDKWLNLVPKCGMATETIMLRHVQSTVHEGALSQKLQSSRALEERKGFAGVGVATPLPGPCAALHQHLSGVQQCKESVKLEFDQSSESGSDCEFDDGTSSGDDDGSEEDDSEDLSGGLLLSCSGSEVEELVSSPESSTTSGESEDVSFASGSQSGEGQASGIHSSSDLLANLCWGLWQPEVEINNSLLTVKNLLADEKGGADWWAEPHTKASVCCRGKVYTVVGCFRHRQCERLSHADPFPNLCCRLCSQIPMCTDFRDKAVGLGGPPHVGV